ncbi:MAG: hypothetical protein QOE32_2849 [Pseudonocardiales bacterium]|nr:hypothetical protein [Pseudonocardiales bacterium]MDT7585299.1 hypothetical protein [Pseudonocardiales bacterium]
MPTGVRSSARSESRDFAPQEPFFLRLAIYLELTLTSAPVDSYSCITETHNGGPTH